MNQVDPFATRLQRWLLSHPVFGPRTELLSSAPLAGGQSSELFRFVCRSQDADPEAFVIRREPRAKQLFLSPDIVREYRVVEGVANAGRVPVAPLVTVEPDETVLGAPFMVMREVVGRAPLGRPSMHQAGMLPELTATERAKLWDSAMRALADIHSIDWREVHPFLATELGGGTGLDQRLALLERWYAWSAAGRKYPLCDAALDYLRGARPASDIEETLLWGDARPGNILFDSDQSVAAVLDWEGALVGPADLDLGYWVMMDSFHTDMIGVDRLPGWPSEAETIARYETLTGRKARHIDYFVVMGAFFIATTVIRAANIGVSAGKLNPNTRMGHDNTATQIIAQRLGLDEPGLSPDFIKHRGLDPSIHRIGP